MNDDETDMCTNDDTQRYDPEARAAHARDLIQRTLDETGCRIVLSTTTTEASDGTRLVRPEMRIVAVRQ
jgi:hypothetical protein